MNKTELTQHIENLQSEIDALKAEAAKCPDPIEPTIDWDQMIGRVVEVRNYDNQAWKRGVLIGYNPDSNAPFKCDFAWEQCRLYEGPTRPNWIEWHGDKCPVVGDALVLAEFRNGEIRARPAEFFLGWKFKNRDDDIMRYTEIQL